MKALWLVFLCAMLALMPMYAHAQMMQTVMSSPQAAGTTTIALGSHCVADNQSGGTASCTLTVSAGDLITVGSDGRAGTSFTVTDSASQTYTPVYFATDSSNPSISGIEYTANSTSGSITVSSDAGISSSTSAIFAQAWHNVATVTPLDATFSSSFFTSSTAGTVANGNCGTARTPGNTNSLVLALGIFDNVTPTVGTNFTVIDSDPVTPASVMQRWIQTTVTSTTGAFVSAADDWSVGCAAFHQ
jgi:hypothetical protein